MRTLLTPFHRRGLMSFPARVAAFLAMLALISACGPRDDKYNPTHFSVVGPVAPPDVVMPEGVKPGETFHGIHPSWSVDDACCAADARLDLPISKAGFATILRLNAYLKGATAGQRFVITFPDGTKRSTSMLKSEFVSGTVRLPPSLQSVKGIVRIGIAAQRGPFVLLSVYFE
jgi:hypothetical protein